MNNRDIKKIALRVVAKILEETTYLFVDEIESESALSIPEDGARGVSLFFEEEGGEFSGVVHLWVPEEFSTIVASNMLGVEIDDPEAADKGFDALCEVLNIILGNLLTEVFGVDPIFSIGIPQARPLEFFSGDLENPNSLWMQAEDSPVFFLFDFQAEKL